MRTVTGVNTVSQLLTYSKQAEAGIHQKAIQMLLGAGKHTYLLQESRKTINVDTKIKQLNDINWIEIGYKEGDTFSVYGKEYAIDSSGHINVSAEDEFISTEIKYPSRSMIIEIILSFNNREVGLWQLQVSITAVAHRIMLQITRILLKKQIVKRIVQIQKTAT